MPDNRLSFTDQLLFLGQQATGQELAMQCVWVYERAIDIDGLRQIHADMGYGLFGRRIEPSPLPFGRHRWVSSLGPPSDLDVAEQARPRSELGDWLDERAQLPIDPAHGPAWHIGVLPMTDGSTAVSMVVSHCLADGLGALLTGLEAVKRLRRDLGYPAPGARTRLRVAATDLRQTAQGAPEVARTLVAAARLAYRRRREATRQGQARRPANSPTSPDHQVVAPAITIFVDLDIWDSRANDLGGTSNSLVAGFAAKLGERFGRRRASDGAVTLHIPINERTLDDTRANAAAIAQAIIDPSGVTTDLTDARAEIRNALSRLRETPDEMLALLPLTPFIPKRAVKRGSEVLFGFDDLPVSCSNLGDLDPAVARVDGSDAEYVILRGIDRHVTRQYLESRGGLLTVVAGRLGGKISMTVVAYQPGAENSKPRLREIAAGVLAEFGLTGVIE